MLEHLFTSGVKRRLLRLFLEDYENHGRLHVREICRRIGGQTNAVRRELEKLEKMGLIENNRLANLKFYRVNKDFLFYKELKEIFKKAGAVDPVTKFFAPR